MKSLSIYSIPAKLEVLPSLLDADAEAQRQETIAETMRQMREDSRRVASL